jgi:hypothetical protein
MQQDPNGEVDRDRRSGRVRLLTHRLWRRPCKLELTNPKRRPLSAPILARFSSHWNSVDRPYLITSLSPGCREKMAKHSGRGGAVAGRRERFIQLRERARVRTGQTFPIIVIQEAGRDGFWIDLVLQKEAIESHELPHGRKRRRQEWSRPPEPRPQQAGYWCSPDPIFRSAVKRGLMGWLTEGNLPPSPAAVFRGRPVDPGTRRQAITEAVYTKSRTLPLATLSAIVRARLPQAWPRSWPTARRGNYRQESVAALPPAGASHARNRCDRFASLATLAQSVAAIEYRSRTNVSDYVQTSRSTSPLNRSVRHRT